MSSEAVADVLGEDQHMTHKLVASEQSGHAVAIPVEAGHQEDTPMQETRARPHPPR